MKLDIVSAVVLILAFSVLFSHTMASSDLHASVEMTNSTIYRNQKLELTATVTGGAPPYSYQWYSIFMPQEVLDQGFPWPPSLVKVEIPGANSSKLEFTESTPGTYNINLEVKDSTGFDLLVSSPDFVTVLNSTYPEATTSTPASSSQIPEFSSLTVLSFLSAFLLATVVIVMRRRKL